MIDVSIYKQATDALNDGYDCLVEFVDALPQMAWIANPNGKVNHFNGIWYQYTGMRLTQTEGWVKFMHPEDSSQIISAWYAALRTSEYHMECRIRNQADGSYRWFLEQARPLRGEEGQIVVWFGTYTDIDDQKQDMEP